MNREFDDIPWGQELFPFLLPWALKTEHYTNIEARDYCASAFGLSPEQKRRPRPSGDQPAWNNYAAHALKIMTEKELHAVTGVSGERRHYEFEPEKIRNYIIKKGLIINFQSLEDIITSEFNEKLFNPPDQTEIYRLGKQRMGQQILRRWLIHHYKCRCMITNIDHPSLLRASHIKAWANCDNNEKMDINNVLLLSAHVDAAFDSGLISFDKNGKIFIKKELDKENRQCLGIRCDSRIAMTSDMEYYMAWHRQKFGFERDTSFD